MLGSHLWDTTHRDAPPDCAPSPPARELHRASSAKPQRTRDFERADIPLVTEMFLATFRDRASHRKQVVGDAIEATYFGSPSQSPDTGSIVHVDERGRVDGFMGVINIGLRIGERSVRAGVLSAYMADRAEAKPEIGVRLARAVVSRPLDVLFTDTANRTSLDISRAMRFTVVPTLSLEWIKLLRPVGTGAFLLARHRPRLRRWVAPVAAAVDARLPVMPATAIDDRCLEGTVDRTIALADFVARAFLLVPRDGLRPAWEAGELTWLLTQAALRTRYGPLHLREVLDRSGRCIGLYLLYAERGNVAYALQVLAQPGREAQVLGNLVVMAERCGAVAVRGASSPPIVEGLLRQRGVFYRSVMSTIARTSDPEVAAAIKSGNVTLGGLAGETWTRIFGDNFSDDAPSADSLATLPG